MKIQINAEVNDTLETAAASAVFVSNTLQINVEFFWDRVSVFVRPGMTVADVVGEEAKQQKQARLLKEGAHKGA